jgi:ADP-ribosylglycohydrolase
MSLRRCRLCLRAANLSAAKSKVAGSLVVSDECMRNCPVIRPEKFKSFFPL